MDCLKNRRILIIVNLVGSVSSSFCNCKRSESSLLKLLALGKVSAMIFVENFLSYL